jgi:membrane fusion protein (multidrug efflux system)
MDVASFNWHRLSEFTWRALVFIVAIGILVIVTLRFNRWEGRPGWQSTDDAYLQADITPLVAKVAGYVRDVPVQDFEHVHSGQLIAQIVEDDYLAALALAQANLGSAQAQADALKAQRELQLSNIQAADAVVAATRASLEQNVRDLARQKKLFETGSSSTEAAEKLDTVRAQLTAQVAQTSAQAASAQRQLAVLAAQEAQIAAAAAAQRANLKTAELNLGYTKILATQDGVIGQRQVKPGQYVGVGSQITTLTPLPNLWVIANYKETQLAHMAVGQKAEIVVDTFPDHTLKGHLLAFSPASGAQFALLPPDNATGNFTKVVQRIAVKIAIDDADGLAARLTPGMSVEARIDAREATRP